MVDFNPNMRNFEIKKAEVKPDEHKKGEVDAEKEKEEQPKQQPLEQKSVEASALELMANTYKVKVPGGRGGDDPEPQEPNPECLYDTPEPPEPHKPQEPEPICVYDTPEPPEPQEPEPICVYDTPEPPEPHEPEPECLYSTPDPEPIPQEPEPICVYDTPEIWYQQYLEQYEQGFDNMEPAEQLNLLSRLISYCPPDGPKNDYQIEFAQLLIAYLDGGANELPEGSGHIFQEALNFNPDDFERDEQITMLEAQIALYKALGDEEQVEAAVAALDAILNPPPQYPGVFNSPYENMTLQQLINIKNNTTTYPRLSNQEKADLLGHILTHEDFDSLPDNVKASTFFNFTKSLSHYLGSIDINSLSPNDLAMMMSFENALTIAGEKYEAIKDEHPNWSQIRQFPSLYNGCKYSYFKNLKNCEHLDFSTRSDYMDKHLETMVQVPQNNPNMIEEPLTKLSYMDNKLWVANHNHNEFEALYWQTKMGEVLTSGDINTEECTESELNALIHYAEQLMPADNAPSEVKQQLWQYILNFCTQFINLANSNLTEAQEGRITTLYEYATNALLEYNQ